MTRLISILKWHNAVLSQYLSKPEHDLLFISYIILLLRFLSLQLTNLIKSLLEYEKMCKSEKYCNSY